MNIKKFTDYSLKENKEEDIENKMEDIQDAQEEVSETSEDGIPHESDLNEIGEESNDETESTDSKLSDDTIIDDVPFTEPVAKNESLETSVNTNGCKIVIINGCEPDSEIDKKTEEFKSKSGSECKEIYLYQLNIQTAKKQEPKDGMMQVYDAIENADAIILACQVNKGKLSESLEIAISRIKNYYKKEELKNKIFGAIIIGNDEKVKNDLILTALNDFHMVICADSLCFSNDKGATNLTKMIDSITTLASATALINKEEVDLPDETTDNEEIKSYDEFSDKDQIEDPTENGLEDAEIEDEYMSDLKDSSDISIDGSDSEETSEEEERLIDNEDGTITQIHKGEKVTENKDIMDDFTILPFDKFIK